MSKKFKILVSIFLVAILTQITLLTEAKCIASTEKGKEKDIVDIAIEDGRFKTLVEALKAADLVDALKGKGPFTVFAPTDDAFEKLGKDKINELLKPENKEMLKDILTYHVFNGKVLSQDAKKLDGKEINMLNNKKAKIEVKGNCLYIDGAKVIVTDINAKNGVIHVIDTVMIP